MISRIGILLIALSNLLAVFNILDLQDRVDTIEEKLK